MLPALLSLAVAASWLAVLAGLQFEVLSQSKDHTMTAFACPKLCFLGIRLFGQVLVALAVANFGFARSCVREGCILCQETFTKATAVMNGSQHW